MKTVCEYQELLEYLNHLGFAGSVKNPICYRQEMLCKVADVLHEAADGLPFKVRAHALRTESGYFPWLGWFEIHDRGGKRVIRLKTST